MTAERRMDRLEGGLSPKEATLLWLQDAHAHGSLVDDCAWLVDRPVADAPLERIRTQALTAVRQAMRGAPGEQVDAAEDQAERDMAFLFELVMRTNAAAEEAIRLGGPHYGMLFWEMRAISAEAHDEDLRAISPGRWQRWRAYVRGMLIDVRALDEALGLLEGRYLDGRIVLFPDVVERWERLREAVEDLARLGEDLTRDDAQGRRARSDLDALRVAVHTEAVIAAERITDEVRAHALDIPGDHAGSAAIYTPRFMGASGGPGLITLRVLDLFSGLRGWSAPFAERGHETFAIDIDRRFDADAYLDIGDVAGVLSALPWRPDVVLASPPCTAFTTMTMGRNWTHAAEPRTASARDGRRLVLATLRIIAATGPKWWLIENPRARLRTLDLLDGIPRRTVTYCQFGEERMKPTDLFGLMPTTLILPPACRNGATCHVRAPRGSRTGTQGGVDGIRAALIPPALAPAVCRAVEVAAAA